MANEYKVKYSAQWPQLGDLPADPVQAIKQLSDSVRRLLLIINQRDLELATAINYNYEYVNCVRRPTVNAYDFDQTSFTMDSLWHRGANGKDLSSIIPIGTKAIFGNMYIWDNVPGSGFYIEPTDYISGSGYVYSAVNSMVSGISNYNSFMMEIGDSRKIDYFVSTGTDQVGLTIQGWFT